MDAQEPAPGRALVFGEVLYDCFETDEAPGGAPLNVAVHLRRAGWEVALLSRVGEDSRGAGLRQLLAAEGLDDGNLQVDPSAPTGTVGVEVGPGGEPCFTIHEGVAWDAIALPDPLPAATLLYVGTLAARAPVSRATFEALLDAPFPWKVFDVNLRQDFWSPEVLERGLAAATLVKLNRDELGVLAAALGLEADPAAFLARYPGLRHVCLTLGPEGARLFTRGEEPVSHPALPGEVVDTVGAGDALCGALVGALARGVAPADALAAGAANAARVCACRGAIPPR